MKLGSFVILIILVSFLTGCVRPAPKIVLNPQTIQDGKVGVEYSARIDVENVDTPFSEYVETELPPGLELKKVFVTGAPDYLYITGTPEKSGEFEFAFQVSCPPVGMLHEPPKGRFEYSIRIQPSETVPDKTDDGSETETNDR